MASDREELIKIAETYVLALKDGQPEEAFHTLQKINETQHRGLYRLYQEVGQLTRQMYDSLSDFDLRGIANDEIPSAAERLQEVVNVTEDAANKTMDSVDKANDFADKLVAAADKIKALADASNAEDVGKSCDELKANLSGIQEELTNILMAQTFQDLTGQVIRRVVDIMGQAQVGLMTILTHASQELGMQPNKKKDEDGEGDGKNERVLSGNVGDKEACDQGEIDDILSDLGF